jgi:hypothetical protein
MVTTTGSIPDTLSSVSATDALKRLAVHVTPCAVEMQVWSARRK